MKLTLGSGGGMAEVVGAEVEKKFPANIKSFASPTYRKLPPWAMLIIKSAKKFRAAEQW